MIQKDKTTEIKTYTQMASMKSFMAKEDSLKELHAMWLKHKLEQDDTDVGFHFVVDYIPATADPRMYSVFFLGQDYSEIDIPREALTLIGEVIGRAGLDDLEFGVAVLKVSDKGQPVADVGSAHGYKFKITAEGELVHQTTGYLTAEEYKNW